MYVIWTFVRSLYSLISHVRILDGFWPLIEVIIFSICRVLPPPVAWAQRKNVVFLTICVEDCREPTITIEDSKIYFKGTGGAEKKDYEYTYNLFKDIDAEVSTIGYTLFSHCTSYSYLMSFWLRC